jgi:hypothetical protein
MTIDIKNLDLEDAKKLYFLPDDMPEFIFLTKGKDGRYKVWDSDATMSGLIVKIIKSFNSKADYFLQKILNLLQ